jgi:hypothetical protein
MSVRAACPIGRSLSGSYDALVEDGGFAEARTAHAVCVALWGGGRAEKAFDGDDGVFLMEVSAALNAPADSPAEMQAVVMKMKACLEGMNHRKMAVLKLCEQREMDWQQDLSAESEMATQVRLNVPTRIHDVVKGGF